MSFYGPFSGEPVLSQRRDLLEQPQYFYEPDVLPATQPIMSKHYYFSLNNQITWLLLIIQNI